jgi:hypothetical protein
MTKGSWISAIPGSQMRSKPKPKLGTMSVGNGLLQSSVNLHCTGCQIISGSLAPAVVGGLIGGATVFLGVWCAEYAARRREQTQRFRDEYWLLLSTTLEFFTDIPNLTANEFARRSNAFIGQLGRLRSAARPPQTESNKKILAVEAMLHRYDVERAVWRQGGRTPDMEFVLGNEISQLALHLPWWREPWKRVHK